MSNLQTLAWTEVNQEIRDNPFICDSDKSALWIAADNLVFRYNIKANPNSTKLPFIVDYGGRHPKEVDSIEYGKHWAEHTHYASKMNPYVKPTWINPKKELPKVEVDTQFICAYPADFFKYVNIVNFNVELGEFDFQHDDVLGWMPIPDLTMFDKGE